MRLRCYLSEPQHRCLWPFLHGLGVTITRCKKSKRSRVAIICIARLPLPTSTRVNAWPRNERNGRHGTGGDWQRRAVPPVFRLGHSSSLSVASLMLWSLSANTLKFVLMKTIVLIWSQINYFKCLLDSRHLSLESTHLFVLHLKALVSSLALYVEMSAVFHGFHGFSRVSDFQSYSDTQRYFSMAWLVVTSVSVWLLFCVINVRFDSSRTP